MFEFMKNRVTETSTWVGIATMAAYVIMWFTPDSVDALIVKGIEIIGGATLLGASGYNILKKD